MFASASSVKESIGRKERRINHAEEVRNAKRGAVDSNDRDSDSSAYAIGKDVRDFIENALESASESLAQAKEKISDTTDTVTHSIQDKPLTSAALCVMAGVFLGALFFRR